MSTTAGPVTPFESLEDHTELLGEELDRIRAEVVAARGAEDTRYIRTVIAAQRGLETGGRVALAVSLFPPAWLAGTAMLTTAKILENMELGHNILHGQWDWMGDPAIHSTTWEWDFLTPADAWKHTHNHLHHTYTNVVGLDRDLGYTILRMSPDQRWHPVHLLQPLYTALLAPFFEWGIALYDLEADAVPSGRKSVRALLSDLAGLARKAVRQAAKDYVLFPLLAGPSALPCLVGNVTANGLRNIWAHTVIFCGHFPGDVQTFLYEEEQLEGETRGQWYLRQIQGSANIEGGSLLHMLTGNLSHQIEHHVFPDLPSNRYAELAPRVREICARHGITYASGPLWRQYASMWGRVLRHAVPDGPQRRRAWAS
ncbi:acyl-CoA desaturase [Streptomyces sp. RLB3-17]|uniref:fatty acid desaturase family protein n=1 Tax=unclassified Streptomyces TaxID=2593676 RepID=UPI001164BE14|nr:MULTISPECIES: acyl-CoA desaturase [unclassified Streptomyces]NMI56017.1 acyl-CoA desaturase [Streptomyces sp. RLA2-12]QDN55472.1 acyl-CoA desaturase [Streptomyces sp. S1D4-20]QDN65650.1 acyl-CoA desaturase [Streptomyces sp. S1D4-14]QDN96294.1 acyl-CoA desaturase [Streptomyces sp. RLB1-9]QDO18003.1 acyl-CoA desaturase [Streptomyces sp. S1A1-8]